MTDAAKIAAGLTKDRAAALKRVAESGPVKLPRYGTRPYVWLYLRNMIVSHDMDAGTFCITPLGLEVRKLLQEQANEQ